MEFDWKKQEELTEIWRKEDSIHYAHEEICECARIGIIDIETFDRIIKHLEEKQEKLAKEKEKLIG